MLDSTERRFYGLRLLDHSFRPLPPMPRVLLSGRIHDDGLAVFRARPDIVIEEMPDGEPQTFVRLLPSADALLIRTATLPREALVNAPRLKVVSRHGVGYDNVPVDALTAKGIPLALAIGANAESVAEHAISMMFSIAKRQREADHAVRAGDFDARSRLPAFELGGRALLIIGYGRVGRVLARFGTALGMRVMAYDPFVTAEAMQVERAAKVEDWRGVLGEADVISLHVPRLPETENMIAAAELRAMRPDAILINTSRGGLIDENALAAALAEGRLAGAGIDTFDEEPPRFDSRLLSSDRVILSPHMAGLTREAHARLGRIAAENVVAALDGRLDPAMVVNKSVMAK
jgi:D-3-phosphoglycerate dehydrogenase / 2-oxoglutarate reductase